LTKIFVTENSVKDLNVRYACVLKFRSRALESKSNQNR